MSFCFDGHVATNDHPSQLGLSIDFVKAKSSGNKEEYVAVRFNLECGPGQRRRVGVAASFLHSILFEHNFLTAPPAHTLDCSVECVVSIMMILLSLSLSLFFFFVGRDLPFFPDD